MPTGIYKHVHIPWNKGIKIDKNKYPKMGHLKKHSVETKQKMSLSWKREKHNCIGMTGKKHSKKTKEKMSLVHGGTGIPQRPTKRYYHLQDAKYKNWRSNVFERDNWTCQTCGKRGCYLEPHHIKGWAKYSELRYELSNGVSLCIECHKLTRKKH